MSRQMIHRRQMMHRDIETNDTSRQMIHRDIETNDASRQMICRDKRYIRALVPCRAPSLGALPGQTNPKCISFQPQCGSSIKGQSCEPVPSCSRSGSGLGYSRSADPASKAFLTEPANKVFNGAGWEERSSVPTSTGYI